MGMTAPHDPQLVDASFLGRIIASVAAQVMTGPEADAAISEYRNQLQPERKDSFNKLVLAIAVASERVCQNRL